LLAAAFLPLPTVAWAIAIAARRSVQRLFNIAEATNIANNRNFLVKPSVQIWERRGLMFGIAGG